MIKIIANFANTYCDISIWIINNQHRSLGVSYTSLARRSLGLNASIHLSMISCRLLFHQWLLSKNQDRFCSRIPHIPKSDLVMSWLMPIWKGFQKTLYCNIEARLCQFESKVILAVLLTKIKAKSRAELSYKIWMEAFFAHPWLRKQLHFQYEREKVLLEELFYILYKTGWSHHSL